MMKNMKIILRTCAIVNTVGSSTRPFDLSKQEIILKCLKSLLESCRGYEKRIFLEIVDDSSGSELIKKMRNILKDHSIKNMIHEKHFGNNGKSAEFCYSLAEKSNEDLIYFLEDDYFHLKHAISSILGAYDSKILFTNEFCIFPLDYPRLYKDLEPALIFMGKYNYWRGVRKTTGTFIIPNRLFRKYNSIFFAFAKFNIKSHGGEKETINKLWENQIPCISPMPSLTAHLHKTSMPYFIDWKKEIDKIKI